MDKEQSTDIPEPHSEPQPIPDRLLEVNLEQNTENEENLEPRDPEIESGSGVVIEDHDEVNRLEEQANLKALLNHSMARVKDLEAQLQGRDSTIVNLQRSCNLMEMETALAKRELEISVREKESAVMRYAMVEKKVIDANVAKDQAEKKYKETQKELEVASSKIKALNTEKTRICHMLDQKVGSNF